MRNKKIDLNEKLRKVSSDILFIGGGGAGLRAAIGAHDSGADVLIISKSKKGDPHTVLATDGINGTLATMNPNDSWMIHAADALKEGCFLADS
jgi:succinate dehydrogenase / fumarate reductase, flavoprotein subunit